VDAVKSFAALQVRVFEFLEQQDEATLRAIINGSAQLGVVPIGDPAPAAPRVELPRGSARVAEELSQLSSEQRRSYLGTANLTVSELKDVAKLRGLRRYSKLAKDQLVEALVTHGSVETSSDARADGPGRNRPAAMPPVESDEPHHRAAYVASRLRELQTEEEGAEFLRAQRLDRAALLAVATELHLTRVDRLNRTELERRVLKQAIGARRKFAALRKW